MGNLLPSNRATDYILPFNAWNLFKSNNSITITITDSTPFSDLRRTPHSAHAKYKINKLIEFMPLHCHIIIYYFPPEQCVRYLV